MFALIGLLVGSVCGFGSVYAADYMDSSFSTQDALGESMGVPVLGSVSKIVTEEEIDKKRKTTRRVWWLVILTTFFILTVGLFVAKNLVHLF